MYSSRRVHYIPGSPKSFLSNKDGVLDHPVDLNNNNNNNNNNIPDFIDKESSNDARKLSITPPTLGKHSPYNDGQHSPSYFDRKSPSYREDRSTSPVYAGRLDTSDRSRHQQSTALNFPTGTMTEQHSPTLPNISSPLSRRTSESSSISPNSIKSNSIKEQISRIEEQIVTETTPITDTEQSTLTVDPVDMLIKLFPLRQVFTLRDALKNHNNDPVRAIEHLLYGKTSSSNESITNRQYTKPSYCHQKSEESRAEQKKNIINDDLSSLAKAYDIPVSEDRIITSKVVNW